jgi:hypothetical protein
LKLPGKEIQVNLIFYSTKTESEGRRIVGLIKPSLNGQKLRTFRTILGLRSYLYNFPAPEAAILVAADLQELNMLGGLKKHLGQIPLIMILPDRSEESLTRAASLSPLLASFLDSDFEEVAALAARLRSLRPAAPAEVDPKRYGWSGDLPYLSDLTSPRGVDTRPGPGEMGSFA